MPPAGLEERSSVNNYIKKTKLKTGNKIKKRSRRTTFITKKATCTTKNYTIKNNTTKTI